MGRLVLWLVLMMALILFRLTHGAATGECRLMADTVEKLKKGVAIKSRRAPVEPGSWRSNTL